LTDSEVLQNTVSVTFKNVTLEPAKMGRSRSSPRVAVP
jgi:hypothetical protein